MIYRDLKGERQSSIDFYRETYGPRADRQGLTGKPRDDYVESLIDEERVAKMAELWQAAKCIPRASPRCSSVSTIS